MSSDNFDFGADRYQQLRQRTDERIKKMQNSQGQQVGNIAYVESDVPKEWRKAGYPTLVKVPEQKIKLFKVRNSHAIEGWREQGAEIEGVTLTIVGWVVTDDGTWTHIASVRDSNDNFGDGIVVPNVAILEVLNVVVV